MRVVVRGLASAGERATGRAAVKTPGSRFHREPTTSGRSTRTQASMEVRFGGSLSAPRRGGRHSLRRGQAVTSWTHADRSLRRTIQRGRPRVGWTRALLLSLRRREELPGSSRQTTRRVPWTDRRFGGGRPGRRASSTSVGVVRRRGRRCCFGSADAEGTSSSFGRESAHRVLRGFGLGRHGRRIERALGKSSRNHRFGGGKAETEREADEPARARRGRTNRSLLRGARLRAKARRRMTRRVAARNPVFGRRTERRRHRLVAVVRR